MNIGMLWFDNDTKSDLFTKVNRAAIYYQDKYGKQPNICFVHPSMVLPKSDDQAIKAGKIEVRLTKSVRPHHFWIGIQSLNGSPVT